MRQTADLHPGDGRRLAWAITIAFFVLILVSPWTISHIKAAVVLAEVLPSSPRPLRTVTSPPAVKRMPLGNSEAVSIHGERSSGRGVVLIHGVNPEGADDPRLLQLGSALARAGHPVLAPSMALARQRIDAADLGLIAAAVRRLAEATGDDVIVLAFSYGAGYTLVSLEEDPGVQEHVAAVATVGTYYDLSHLAQGLTTGRIIYDGNATRWEPPEGVAEEVAAFLAGQLRERREGFTTALERRDPTGLSPNARALYDLMANRDPHRTGELIERLPEPLSRVFERFSPSRRIEKIDVPVWALHSTDDPASPWSESRELVMALKPRVEARLTRVESFRHVAPAAGRGWLVDGGALLSYTARMLRR